MLMISLLVVICNTLIVAGSPFKITKVPMESVSLCLWAFGTGTSELTVNARTVSACWLLCHHRAVRPS